VSLFSHAFAPLFQRSHLVSHLINPLDGQHKQLARQRQQREQCCQAATSADLGAIPIDASSNASDYAINDG
jgi:hypothetical protein